MNASLMDTSRLDKDSYGLVWWCSSYALTLNGLWTTY